MMEIKKTVLFNIDKIINKVPVEERQVVAELGCGNFGFFTFPLARKVGKKGIVYAVDILKNSLDEVERRLKENNLEQVQPIWSDLEIYKGTKIESESLDSAFLVNVLHQSNKRPEMIREAGRMLKRGGKLVIVEWNSADTPLGPPLERRLKKEALKNAALKLGYEIEEEFEAGDFHFGLILVKI